MTMIDDAIKELSSDIEKAHESLRPDPGIWWKIVEKYKVNVMFSAPTAARVLKKQDPAFLHKHDVSSLKHIFMAGEPLDQPTHEWFMTELQKPVIDNYWQTETGWPMLAAVPGVEKTPIKYGSPSFPVYGYNLKIYREDGSECEANEKGIAAVVPPLPPGCLTTVWGQDDRFVSTYFTLFKEPMVQQLRLHPRLRPLRHQPPAVAKPRLSTRTANPSTVQPRPRS